MVCDLFCFCCYHFCCSGTIYLHLYICMCVSIRLITPEYHVSSERISRECVCVSVCKRMEQQKQYAWQLKMYRNHFQLLPLRWDVERWESEVCFSHPHRSMTNYTSQVRIHSCSCVHRSVYNIATMLLRFYCPYCLNCCRLFYFRHFFFLFYFFFFLFYRVVKYKCEIYAICLVLPSPLTPPPLSPHSNWNDSFFTCTAYASSIG